MPPMNKGPQPPRQAIDEDAADHHPTSPAAVNVNDDRPKTSKLHSTSTSRSWCRQSPKLFLHLIATSVVVFTLFQINSLASSTLLPSSWSSPLLAFGSNCKLQQGPVAESLSSSTTTALEKLRRSVTFLPLKDLRYAPKPMVGHTWFMSTLNDTHVDGEVQYQQFPSEASRGRLLCLKGRDHHDGAWNSYALAWPEALPENATLRAGLTFVSYTHYVYSNIWHGLSAMVPFAAWHLRNGCRRPARWVPYYLGELRTEFEPWLTTIMEAVYGADGMKIEELEGGDQGEAPVCFEEAVVMRHNEGGMSRQRLVEVFDLLRCKARSYCNVTTEKHKTSVGVTMLMRTGARSFKNDTRVIGIFDKECRDIQGCRIQVAYPINLTVCQQVKIMSETDVLITPHGAQLTNMFLMDKGSSVMEFFPKGWLKLAGVGQYVFQWLADWSGMHHEGVWRDPDGPPCQYPEDDGRCMSVYKNAQIGHNETRFHEWARTVFNQAKARILDQASKPAGESDQLIGCGCP